MSSTSVVPTGSIRQSLKTVIENSTIQRVLLALILINAVILGLETSPEVMTIAGSFLIALDKAILAVFVVELSIRLFVHRFAFFKDGWNVFDFIVVGVALVPASGPFAVLRALRVLRVLRVLTFVPSMKKIVGALIKSLNGMLSIAMVLGLLYYVAAVMVTKLFGEAFPEWFGSLGASLYTLFQVMTLESWSMGIARPVMEAFPYAWAFFIPFILIATFTMLNLFIAVIVNAVQTMHDDDNKDELDAEKVTQQQLLEKMQQLQSELQALRRDINKPQEEESESR
ncbi:ion transporter [Marinomonas rhizomae]|uniref:Voltage-gated sodium channel n=1 Tax=Marinomonas rhizomae TaxID=491948 RepID=A0A366JG32_9GAMM|nr:ion transporter [Marinomonas rhizomae]RBP85274.1 voltage-gated sodium channel [Marinomonas rhizomae]RNF76370.1 ion transporter [Marinomonas rhizomae]